jgi:hypothetical protein
MAERLNRQFRFIGKTSRPLATGSGDELGVSAKAFFASIPATMAPVFLMKSLLSIMSNVLPNVYRTGRLTSYSGSMSI